MGDKIDSSHLEGTHTDLVDIVNFGSNYQIADFDTLDIVDFYKIEIADFDWTELADSVNF